MRHSFYASATKRNVDRSFKASIDALNRNRGLFPVSKAPKPKKSVKRLEDHITEALKRYEEDPEARTEILDKVSMYQANVAIARQYNDKKSEETLTRELVDYLKNK